MPSHLSWLHVFNNKIHFYDSNLCFCWVGSRLGTFSAGDVKINWKCKVYNCTTNWSTIVFVSWNKMKPGHPNLLPFSVGCARRTRANKKYAWRPSCISGDGGGARGGGARGARGSIRSVMSCAWLIGAFMTRSYSTLLCAHVSRADSEYISLDYALA